MNIERNTHICNDFFCSILWQQLSSIDDKQNICQTLADIPRRETSETDGEKVIEVL